MKSILGKCFIGLGVILSFVWMSAPTPAYALANCSTLPIPRMQISIPGYGTFANSTSNPDAVYTITVPSGTVLTATYSNFSGAADNYTIFDSWPVSSQTIYHSNPGSRTHTSVPITSAASFGITLDPNCTEDPSPGEGGTVTVNVNIAATPAPTVSLSASPTTVSSGSPTTLTWSSTNTTSCTATAGSGFSTGGATSGSDASSALTTQTVFTVSCTGAGGTASRSVTVGISAAPTAPTCSISPSSALVGATVTATAANGSGGTAPYYTWNTGGGGVCATGATCATTYSTAGSKTMTVTRNGLSGTCSVVITSPENPLPTGALTSTASCTATGWADDVDTTTPRPVRIYSDGALKSTVTAGATGCSGTACTFSADLSGLVSTGIAHAITGEVQGDTNEWIALSNPMSMTCAATPTVSCSGVSAGQTGTSYTFTGTGGSTYTWAVSPTTGFSPSGASGTGSTVTKSFSTTGAKTITFTSGAQTGTCNVTISASAPALGVDLMINGSNGPLTLAYGSLPVLTWSSSGAMRCDSPSGATPADTDWPSSGDVGLSGTQSVSPLVRTTYPLRCVNAIPQTVTDSVVARITPECLPAGQTVTVGQNATLTARGGDGTYAWTATGGTTASGSGSSFTTSYATEGTKTISLTSDSLTATACTVTVSAAPATTGTIIVNSNVASTWSLSGPSDLAVGKTPQTTQTYTDLATGTYTLSAETLAGYQAPVITPASSQALAAGETKTFTITYTALPSGSVDLEVNNSDGPVQIVEGASGLLTWTSSNIVTGSCVASGGWSGAQADSNSSGVSSGAINNDTTFTITCDTASGGTVSDDVDVTTRLPECRDGINNDTEDTRIDFAGNDLGCTNADDDDETNGVPECSDGIDNSDAEDTIADYPDDPGCLTANDDNEDDVEITECSDGFDNDGDGRVDTDDAECTGPTDTSERATPDIREI